MILNENQTQKVKKHLLKSGIESILVYDDLLDYICCLVEEKMDRGDTFDNALYIISQQQTSNKLKDVELFTLKLLNMETSFSTKTSLLATTPFGIFGLAWILEMGINVPYLIKIIIYSISLISMYALLGIGWVKGFPRWSFPAIGFCLISSMLLFYMKPPISEQELGLWAWVPLLITMLIALLFNPSIKPIREIIKKIKDDPTLILFTVYGFVPTFISFFTDEIHSLGMLPFCLLSILILSLGLFGFLRFAKKKTRLWYLLISWIIAFSIIFISTSFYYES